MEASEPKPADVFVVPPTPAPGPAPADKAGASKLGNITIWQAVSTLGVGTVLVMLIVPRMLTSADKSQTFIQEKLVTTLELSAQRQAEANMLSQAQIAATNQQTAAMQMQSAGFNAILPEIKTLVSKMTPLVSRLDRTADGIEGIWEGVKADAERAEAEK